MRRFVAVVLVAAAAIALFATTAPAGEQAVTPKQLAALQKRVKKLENDEKQIIEVMAIMVHCGFDKTAVPTTKSPQFHQPAAGETTDFYVLATTDTQCVEFINSPRLRGLLKRVR